MKTKSQKQEQRVAKEVGGKVTPASGALWGLKGDVRADSILIECKYTDAQSYSVKSAVWKKIKNEALRDRFRIPVLNVKMPEANLAIVDWDDFMYLFEATRAYERGPKDDKNDS